MKKIFLAIFSLLALSFNSCETNEGVLTPNNFTDYAFICSGYTSGSNEMNYIDINNVVSFMNLSKGALAQYWEIEEGCSFVTADYPDYPADNLESVLIEGEINTETTAFVYFPKEGEYTVKLATLFAEEVTYQPTEGGEVYESYYSEELGGYVIRTEFNFKVFGGVNFAYSVYKADGTRVLSVDLDDNLDEVFGSISIVEGEAVTVAFDEMVSNPNLITYTFNNGNPDVVQSVGENGLPVFTATYRTEGSAYSMGSITVQRTAEGEYEGMSTSKSTKSIPLFITVTEKPYESSPITLVEGSLTATTSSVTFGIECLNNVYLGKDVAADFSLMVNNSAVGVVDKAVAVTKVALSSDYKSVTLTLGESLYADDTITLSYSGDGINDKHSTSLTAFADQSVPFYESAIQTDYYGFETTGAAWKSSKTPDAWSYSSALVSGGSYSMCYSNAVAFNGTTVNKTSDKNTVNFYLSQNYTIKYKLYISEDSEISASTLLQFVFTYTYVNVKIEIGSFEKGKWLDLEASLTNGDSQHNTDLASADDSIQIGLVKPGISTIYIDDIDVIVNSKRPAEAI